MTSFRIVEFGADMQFSQSGRITSKEYPESEILL